MKVLTEWYNRQYSGLEESGGTRSSVRYICISEPRIWEETGGASPSMKHNRF